MELEGGEPMKYAKRMQRSLQINILEATDIDRDRGITANADLGVALAASAAALEADPARLDEIMPDLSGLWSRASAALESWAAQRNRAG